MKLSSSLLLLLTLAACTSIPVSTMLKMRDFNPMEADPRNIQIAVRMPAQFGLREEGVKMVLSATHALSGETLKEAFVLESTDKIDSAFLQTEKTSGYEIRTFWIDVGDWQRLRDTQRQIRRWKEKSEDETKGSLEIDVAGCRTDDQALPGKIMMTTYIKFDPDQDFIVLTKNRNLRREADMEGLEEVLPPCET